MTCIKVVCTYNNIIVYIIICFVYLLINTLYQCFLSFYRVCQDDEIKVIVLKQNTILVLILVESLY